MVVAVGVQKAKGKMRLVWCKGVEGCWWFTMTSRLLVSVLLLALMVVNVLVVVMKVGVEREEVRIINHNIVGCMKHREAAEWQPDITRQVCVGGCVACWLG